MDHHFLTPLFAPKSIVVFAGHPEHLEEAPSLTRTMLAELRAGGFGGSLNFLDVDMTGTLSDLAHSRADLAIIALPHERVAAAVEIAGRIRCRAALVLSTGLPSSQCRELHDIARRHGMHLLGPNSLGFQRPLLKLNASATGPMAATGPLALVSQSGALTSSMLDWARQNGVASTITSGEGAVSSKER